MNEFSHATLIAAVLGQLPAEQTDEIRRIAVKNAELAAKFRALEAAAGMSSPVTELESKAVPNVRANTSKKPLHRLLKLLAASMAIVLLLSGAVYAGYELLRDRPLLDDNFRDEWLDTKIWDTYRGRKGIREEGGHLRLLNRGSLVTAQAFPDPIELEFDWQWIDLASDPLYPDYLCVSLHTSGRHDEITPYESLDGIDVNFNPHHGGVIIGSREGGNPAQRSDHGILKFSSGKWYHLRITDDGNTVAVFARGPEIERKYDKEPILIYEYKTSASEHRVSFFNREYIAGANHESRIDNVVIRRLIPK
jgi:hypothetical protein